MKGGFDLLGIGQGGYSSGKIDLTNIIEETPLVIIQYMFFSYDRLPFLIIIIHSYISLNLFKCEFLNECKKNEKKKELEFYQQKDTFFEDCILIYFENEYIFFWKISRGALLFIIKSNPIKLIWLAIFVIFKSLEFTESHNDNFSNYTNNREFGQKMSHRDDGVSVCRF